MNKKIRQSSESKPFYKRWFNWLSNRIDLLGFLLGLLSLIVTVFWNLHQEKSLEELGYKNDAMSFRPRLEVLGNPKIEAIGMVIDSASAVGDTNKFFMQLTFEATLKLVNEGDQIARVVAELLADTLSGNDDLRRSLLSPEDRVKKFDLIPSNKFFLFNEIRPKQDTLAITINHTIQNISKANEGVLHFLVLYQNEIGNLYDTYFWVKYALNPVPGNMRLDPFGFSKKKGVLFDGTLSLAKKDILNAITFSGSNRSRSIYSKPEKEDIFDFFKNLQKNRGNEQRPLVKISTDSSLIVANPGENEFWLFKTNISYRGSFIKDQVNAYVWFDSLSNSSYGTPNASTAVPFNFGNRRKFEFYSPLFKHLIAEYLQQKKDLYKHTVVVYTDLKGRTYSSGLTEKMHFENGNLRWRAVGELTEEILK